VEDERSAQARTAASGALAQSTLLGELLENARIGVLAVDEGRYVAANQYACTLSGYERDDLIGRRVGELNPASALPAQFAEIRGDGRGGGEVLLRRKDGEEVRVSYRVVGATIAGLEILVAFFWPI
jgi:PAS domain S-box-containing protein